MPEVSLPYNWQPRPHQLPFFTAMDNGTKRGCLVWHRRAGKDSASLNFTAKKAFDRVGNYWHCLPKISQARKAIWKGVDAQGRRIIDQAFPKEIRSKTNEQEMLIEFVNGSTWQLVGSDNYDSMVGSNPVGIVFSEYSLSNPSAWQYFRPMLAENGGWAVFIYTARGKNHGFTLYNMAKKNKNWFSELLTVDDTKRENGLPVIGPEIIQEERNEGMGEEMIQQEYYCSFDAQIPGAIFGEQMRKAYNEKRVTVFPIDPSLPLGTAWDLGHRDATSIWFWQATAGEIRLVHYYENNMKDLDHYINYIKEWSLSSGASYKLGRHFGPHDCETMRLGQATTVKAQCTKAGINMLQTVRPQTKATGIQAVRKIFPKLWFHDDNCEQGLACLSEYQYEWDDKLKMFKDNPLHNWASHGFDALQSLALGWNENFRGERKPQRAQNMKVKINVF